MQTQFFSQLGTAQRLVVFRASLSFGFCLDLCLHLYRKQYISEYSDVESVGGAKKTGMYNRWAGLKRQVCIIGGRGLKRQ